VDYFFVLPEDERGPRRQRLELRTDDEGRRLIYSYDRGEPDSRSVNFVIAEVGGASARKLLEAALGVRAIVRKRREPWRKENTRFNLDEVEGAGDDRRGGGRGGRHDSSKQLAGYRELFAPHLGAEIAGSNEDLVART
jgi:hypothetical protein